MSEKTGISWTDHTFNPWWGCHKVSEECAHCYAEATAERFHPGHWGLKAPRWFFGDKHWAEPVRWNKRAERDGVRRSVLCASMADVLESHPIDTIRFQQYQARERLWRLVYGTSWLDWLILTKRDENLRLMLPWTGHGMPKGHQLKVHAEAGTPPIPWPNVWLGVTAGVRSSLSRVATLRQTPAAVRFISCEPLLEHITAADWDLALAEGLGMPIHWLIVGDESGRDRRPAEVEWVRTARDAAERHGVAFHFKQWAGDHRPGLHGERTAGRDGKIHLPMLDGVQHAAFPKVTP